MKLGEYKLALEDLKWALRLNPGDTSTLRWISATDVARSPDYFQQGLLALAREAVDRSPEPARAYTDRGALHQMLKDYDKADVDFRKAAELDPQHAWTWLYWGRMYAPKNKELAKAEAEARKAKRGLWADPNPIPPWEWRQTQREKESRSDVDTGYWRYTTTGSRHNRSCTNYRNTKRGRPCGVDQGWACGMCGG